MSVKRLLVPSKPNRWLQPSSQVDARLRLQRAASNKCTRRSHSFLGVGLITLKYLSHREGNNSTWQSLPCPPNPPYAIGYVSADQWDIYRSDPYLSDAPTRTCPASLTASDGSPSCSFGMDLSKSHDTFRHRGEFR